MKEFALFICFFIFSFGTIEANYVPIDTFPSNMNENILDVRKPNITGYIPDYIVSQKKKFPRTIWRKSKKKLGLTYTPDNPESLPNVKIITPDIISWDEAEFNNPSINLWLIIPADYSHLGVINMIESGTKDSIKVIRPYYPNTSKPYQLIHPSKVEG